LLWQLRRDLLQSTARAAIRLPPPEGLCLFLKVDKRGVGTKVEKKKENKEYITTHRIENCVTFTNIPEPVNDKVNQKISQGSEHSADRPRHGIGSGGAQLWSEQVGALREGNAQQWYRADHVVTIDVHLPFK
jgi:hypothetical protein